MPIINQKQRVSRHNGRAGKHGVYNPKHNDRQFDVNNAENIQPQKTDLNLYWDWQNGLRTHTENVSGQYPTFVQVEHDFYEQRYGPYLAGQTERNIKAGHAKRNRTVDDLLADTRICPEETIYQIGKEGDCPPPEVLTAIVQEFMATITERFGEHVHILDWSLHLDETSPHIHARQVFDVENRYGEIEPKQEKALEALDIPLPEPDKKPSKVNNRKVTFDGLCRDLLLGICQKHGLDIETEAIYGGKKYQEKNDYIISKQNETIHAQEQQLAMQQEQIQAMTIQMAAMDAASHQAEAELQEKEASLREKDTALAATERKLSDAVDDLYRTGKKLEETELEVIHQESRIIVLNEQIESQSTLLAEKDAELAAKELELSDVDALLDDVADIAYEKAVNTVAATVMNEAKRKSTAAVDKAIEQSMAKESGVGWLHREIVDKWLAKAKTYVEKAMDNLIGHVMEKLTAPSIKRVARDKIKETARPIVIKRLEPRLTEKKKRNDVSR